ncbi:MAG: PorT family protein [Prevotella sp.]|nr:PorT family protein [Prevotella sp.]
MMKRFLGLIFVMALMAGTPVSAQGLRFGIRGGANLTELQFDQEMLDAKRRVGWFVGPSLKISLPITALGVDVAALYEQKEAKVGDAVVRQESVVIPVNARLNLGLGDALGLYLAAGPQFGFNVGKDEFKWDESSSYKNTFQLKKASFSVNLGAGVFLSKSLEVGIVYNIAMGNTGEASFSKSLETVTSKDTYTDETKSKTWSVQACLYF